MYKVYVVRQRQKQKGSEVLTDTRTTTPSADAAKAAFRALRSESYGPEHLLLLTHAGKKIAVHRYGSSPGDPEHIELGADLGE
jgi:hypothetical protein